ncbi:glycosyltransferase involved in cell wall biosynthesis [Aliiruegeria haliotis]|uniref:Glycosyltransferase involved in cell wall biosynthesis n=1 Tax=Aliiruegeria haliotis TaxID=1280846 RepID=A0A2T0RPI5_9RHOB|nr:glycosyltransferase family 1 protein [Aliiruegeria haliotis]PRY23061.1 glycosyltransferase involved in cell wall biosynthesis [Aliiruegeria haliotis]
MGSEKAPLCLDLTRLLSRVGRGPWTGVDRVEAAYLGALLELSDRTVFALVRMRFGFVLLDHGGMTAISARLAGDIPWGRPDLLARSLRRPSRTTSTDLRRHALAVTHRRGLPRMLRRHLPPGAAYLNVGHSNLSAPVFRAIREIPGSTICVLVHDLIPLDFSQFQRPGTSEKFEAAMRRVSRCADLVICNSAATEASVCARFTDWGRVPNLVTAHLGLDLSSESVPAEPTEPPPCQPYFVCLGTIEPRKNHAFLLDLWEAMPATERPGLLFLGSRGWNNDDVFRRLATSSLTGETVFEHSGLDDRAVAQLLRGAAGVLFPSHAEGFGLPALEAAALGVPLICNDLPVFHEILGDYPVYADISDTYSWTTAIRSAAKKHMKGPEHSSAQPGIPTWDEHFNLVLSRI